MLICPPRHVAVVPHASITVSCVSTCEQVNKCVESNNLALQRGWSGDGLVMHRLYVGMIEGYISCSSPIATWKRLLERAYRLAVLQSGLVLK